ncbi:ornithine decarboxylase 1-like [Dermacentor albipictus]|uniref:ornithine decarboxylase 1-like n=1 Tax=Dermacentor albipictus TaxID=60249 RepID=UPI0031FE29A5
MAFNFRGTIRTSEARQRVLCLELLVEMCKVGSGIPSLFVDEDVADVARIVIEQKIYEDEAFFLCDVREIKRNVSLWQQELPEIQPYYCVRCCSDYVVLKSLSLSGVNFACGSKHEMRILLDMGVNENRILYNSTTKCPSHLKFAEECGVRLMCCDSAADMKRINGDTARLLLRIAVHDSSKQAFLNDQFGCSLGEAEQLMNLAKENQLSIVGVSFDMGVIAGTDEAFLLTLRNARAVFDLGLRMGFPMTVLDIGGGFPIASQNNQEFKQVCHLVSSALKTYFPSSSGTTVIAEPGQFLVASSYTLAAKVVGKRTKESFLDGKCKFYKEVFINESKYNSIPRHAGEARGISIRPLLERNDQPRNVLTAFWAATSNPRDLIFDKQLFWPVEVNEWLLINNIGAYSLVLACSFNGSGMPPVVYVASTHDADTVSKGIAAASVSSGYPQMERAIKSVRGSTYC